MEDPVDCVTGSPMADTCVRQVVPGRWGTNLDLAGCRLTLSIARGILGSLVMLFEAQHGKYGWGGGVRMVHGHLCVCSTYVSEHSRLRVQFHARHAPPFVQQ